VNQLDLKFFDLVPKTNPVVGQDWGSRAAQAVAVLAPERVTQLVALATGYGPGPDDPERQLRQTHAFWYQWWL